LKPADIPPGSKFMGYKEFVVQDILISNWNTRYLRERWVTPAGDNICGILPKEIDSHFGPTLKAFILYQYYGCCVTQPLIAEQLHELGVVISNGEINNIITENKEQFHNEKERILKAGLQLSGYINVDDTGARHKGGNGFCTHIGNEYFAWFGSTESKSRINFLELLQAGVSGYIINEEALDYMAINGLAKFQLSKLQAWKGSVFKNKEDWLSFLKSVEIQSDLHVRISTEGSLIGSIIHHGFNDNMAIISDDAGQFNVFLHGLCWVHAERNIASLIPCTVEQAEIQESVKAQVWELYSGLKDYRLNPDENDRLRLEKQFDEIFSRRTGYATMDQLLKRLHGKKPELLLVLDRPDIPIHNNTSERDLREYVKRRKISGSTRSETGKRCRDSFTSLKKTCLKLGISFWKYLQDRISKRDSISDLSELLKLQLHEAFP
jgi:hypothetical protein